MADPNEVFAFTTGLSLNGHDFELVCVRRSGVAVYRGNETYLRIGPGMDAELATHRDLLDHGFPVAEIIGVGEHEGFGYVIEESLGAVTLGERFLPELEAQGAIAEEGFASYLSVVKAHTRAQVAMATTAPSRWDFARLVGVDQAAALLPDGSSAVHKAYDRAVATLRDLPRTLVHGDLHEDNMCVGGVIDLEDIGWAPAGYDVVTAVFVPAMCDTGFDTGSRPRAFYSESQVAAHLAMIDELFASRGLAHPSELVNEFLVCRAISLCAKMHPHPGVTSARQRMLRAMMSEFRIGGDLPTRLHAGR